MQLQDHVGKVKLHIARSDIVEQSRNTWFPNSKQLNNWNNRLLLIQLFYYFCQIYEGCYNDWKGRLHLQKLGENLVDQFYPRRRVADSQGFDGHVD